MHGVSPDVETPFRNSMPGSRVGAGVVSRVSTLLAQLGNWEG